MTDERRRRARILVVATIALGLALAFWAAARAFVPHAMLDYDEADYAFAATQGLGVNWLDTTAIPMDEFVRQGLRNLRTPTHAELETTQGESLSEYIRRHDDITFYRHYHGPGFVYAMALADGVLAGDERSLRLASAFAGTLAVGLAALLAARLGRRMAGGGALAAAVAGLALLGSPILLETSATARPHALFALAALASLGAAAMLLATGGSIWRWATGIAIGLSVATLEYVPFVVLAVAAALVVGRGGWRRGARWAVARELAVVAAVAMLTVVVVWPGAVLRLSLVRNYVFFAYYALLHAGEQYGSAALVDVWRARFTAEPQLLLAVVAACWLGWRAIRDRSRTVMPMLPLVFYVALMSLALARNRSWNVTYASSVVPVLAVCLGVAAEHLARRRVAQMLCVLAVAALAVRGASEATPRIARHNAQRSTHDGVVAAVSASRDAIAGGQCLSVPWWILPRLHYYAPGLDLRPYYVAEWTCPDAGAADRFGRCGLALVGIPGSGDDGAASTTGALAVAHTDGCTFAVLRRGAA